MYPLNAMQEWTVIGTSQVSHVQVVPMEVTNSGNCKEDKPQYVNRLVLSHAWKSYYDRRSLLFPEY